MTATVADDLYVWVTNNRGLDKKPTQKEIKFLGHGINDEKGI